jgi:hypothetical protein
VPLPGSVWPGSGLARHRRARPRSLRSRCGCFPGAFQSPFQGSGYSSKPLF